MFAATVPTGPLGRLVATLWSHEGPVGTHATDLRLPTGDTELVLVLGDRPRAVVVGPTTRAFELATADQADAVGVSFRVGGAAALLGLPPGELRDRQAALELAWGAGEADRLVAQALAARGPAERLAAVQRVLTRRLAAVARAPHPAAVRAAARVAAAPEGLRVAAVAGALGLSVRRFEQIFAADVGVTPKAYQRLHRFRRTLERVDEAARIGWAAFALERGYADQAHLIGEFRAHAGLTPTAYASARGPMLNHVALP